MLLSCHFYNVYIVAVWSCQEVNIARIPRMQAVVVGGTDVPQPKPQNMEQKEQSTAVVPQQQPKVIYVPAPYQQPISYVNQNGQLVQQPMIQPVYATVPAQTGVAGQ